MDWVDVWLVLGLVTAVAAVFGLLWAIDVVDRNLD